MPFLQTMLTGQKPNRILQTLFVSFFILFILFLFDSQNVFAGVGIGGACSPTAKCDPNLVCAAPAIGEQEICLGLTGATGCTSNASCAIGNICKNTVCVNDQGAGSASTLRLGEESTDIRVQINRVINIFLSFLAIIGVTLIIYAGIMWETAGGNDEQVGKARKTMIAAAIGLIIIGVAWTIISFVLNLGDTIA